jgi:NAD(P)-dependent dehydrogenase (short-subunit alcohol dehydrogenase family)
VPADESIPTADEVSPRRALAALSPSGGDQLDRVAVVTGAGSGIGQAAALALIRDGWTVVGVGRRRVALEDAISRVRSGSASIAYPADVARPDEVEKLFTFVEASFGRVDLLVNNAGVHGDWQPLEDVRIADWNEVVAVNLTGAFLCAQAAYRIMIRQQPQGGRIINNGSLSAHSPRPNSAAYTATKHAITGLTKMISLEGRRFGIACGQLDVGNACTAMTQGVAAGTMQADGTIAAEPVIDVDLVGKFVAQMASLPLEANVQFATLMATAMPFIGRG